MKAIFEKNILIAAITPASGIVPGRNTASNIEGILFECPGDEPGTCTLSAYDMEKGMRTSVSAKIINEGRYVLNTQKVLQIVRALPDGEVTIEIDEKCRAIIEGGSSSFEINAGRGEDFPALPLLAGERNYTLPQHVLRAIINRTIFAVTQNDQRAAFNGIFFKIEGTTMTVVGCDGNRLAICETDSPDEAVDAKFIVPSKILFELMKLIKDAEEDITISLARKHVIFKVGEFVYFSRLIETEYIDYVRIIPNNHVTEVYVNANALRGAIERASLITEDKLGGSSRTFVKMEFEGSLLKISSVSTGGSIYEEVPIATIGDDIVIGFNCRYLLDALRSCPEEAFTLRLRMNNPLMGLRIEEARGSGFVKEDEDTPVPSEYAISDSEEKQKFIFFIMPVRMNGSK